MEPETKKLLDYLSNYNVVDLTHTLKEGIASWNGTCGFYHELKHDYADCEGEVKFRAQKVTMEAGIGTHIDAPSHCFANGLTIDQLEISSLITEASVIDVSNRADEKYKVSVSDIKSYENSYKKLSPGQIVMFRTGWDRFWDHSERYHNNCMFPSISEAAAEYLLEKQIIGLGIDTLSPDRGDSNYPVHRLILGAGKYIIENVANLNKLPPVGTVVIALPIKIKDATEAPIRMIALVK